MPLTLVRRPGRGARVLRNLRRGRAQRLLSGATAAAALPLGAEIFVNHYGGSFGNKWMWTPVVLSPAVGAAGIAGVASERAARTWLPAMSALYVANGSLGAEADPPTWVIGASALAIALGTYSGGWRIIKTTGTRIIKMDAAQGFSAQGAGAAVILASTHFGFPLSTTHVINGGVMGSGAAKRLSAVRWGVAGNIFVAWLLTLPAAAAIGALTYGFTRIFGTGALGPILVALMGLSLIAVAFSRRAQSGAPVEATGA